MSKILTFGEPLILHYLQYPKLCSEGNSFYSLGGSEINTSISLSKQNNQVYLISSLPDNQLGKEFLNILQQKCIQTDYIYLCSQHQLIGSMYVKDNQVVYQRQYSSFSFLNLINVDIESVSEQSFDWCHLTGITPLLSVGSCLIWRELIELSLVSQVPVSLDLNYRPSLSNFEHLWNLVKPFLSELELFIISVSDISLIAKVEQLELLELQLEQQLLLLADKLKISKLVLCQKHVLENGSQNRCSYLVYQQHIYKSKIKNHTPKEHIGGGDAFVGSLINSILKNDLNLNTCDVITNILDIADYYTINNQENRGNFPKF